MARAMVSPAQLAQVAQGALTVLAAHFNWAVPAAQPAMPRRTLSLLTCPTLQSHPVHLEATAPQAAAPEEPMGVARRPKQPVLLVNRPRSLPSPLAELEETIMRYLLVGMAALLHSPAAGL